MIDPIVPILIPLIGSFILSLLHGTSYRTKSMLALFLSVATVGVSVMLCFQVYTYGPAISLVGGWLPQIGITLFADLAAAVFVALVSFGYFLTLAFRIQTINQVQQQDKSFVFTSIFTASLLGIILTADFFNLFVFIELSTVATIGLITRKRTGYEPIAGFVYLIVAAVSASFLVIGIILIYYSTGSLSMALAIDQFGSLPPLLSWGIGLCFTLSLGMKFGMIPLHLWQPWAYDSAGSIFTGFLSGFGMKAYLFVFIRLLWGPLRAFSHGFFSLLLFFGLANIILGHSMAFIQKDYKKLLAFSSIAHAGYILTAFGLAGIQEDPTLRLIAMTGGIFHMLVHSFIKPALLWTGRHFMHLSNSASIDDLRSSSQGLVIFSVAAITIIGIPPTGGFVSKFIIASTSASIIPILVIVLGTFISFLYYLRLFMKLYVKLTPTTEVSSPLVIPGVLVTLVLLMGLVPSYLIPVIEQIATMVMDSGAYSTTILGFF